MRSQGHYKKINKIKDNLTKTFLIILFFLSVLFACLRCTDEYYLGKTREELTKEMFEVDSLIRTIQMQLDSANIDFEGFYIDAQRINNGHE
jgi:predicted secreted protein|tara:strand:- start:363 stop:635 length:273 start_codon:yes stop_codon:yes gene_type:complete